MAKAIHITQDEDTEKIVISDLLPPANVEVITAGETPIITIAAAGPMGPKGEKGEKGDMGDTAYGIFAPTGSYYSGHVNLKISGSFEVSGSVVNFLNTGTVFGSLFSGSFSGNGSNLVNIPTSSIFNFEQGVAGVVFPYLGKAAVTGSISLLKDTSTGTDFFIIRSGSFNAMSISSQGVLKLGEYTAKPAAVAGGLMYFDSNFWVGVEE